MKEENLYEQIARYMNLKYPDVIYHFDLSGVNNSSHKTRNLYGRLNRRAWPDLFVAKPAWADELPNTGMSLTPWNGLFLELKRDGTRLKKRDGSWANQHIAEQAAMLYLLEADHGYIARFACGFDEAAQLIDSYLGGDATNAKEEVNDGFAF